MIATQVDQLTRTHFQETCGEPIAARSGLRFAAALRVWAAIAFHWKQQQYSLEEQLAHLANKDGSKGNLGSNPLQDMVLCEAVLHGNPTAIAFFTQAHRATILNQVRIHPFLQGEPPLIGREFDSFDDCLTSFVIYVGGLAVSATAAELPDDDAELDPGSSLADNEPRQASLGSFDDWLSFIAQVILKVPTEKLPGTCQAIRDWIAKELAVGSDGDLESWWREFGVPFNAQQSRGVPLAKYRGESGLAGGFVTRCAEYFAKGVLRKRAGIGIGNTDNIPSRPEIAPPTPISPQCLEHIRRWIAAALDAWAVFCTREQEAAFDFIRENFDDLPLRSVGLTSNKRSEVTPARWKEIQERSQRMHLAFLLEIEQGWSNQEIAAQIGRVPGQASLLLQAARELQSQLLQGLKATQRIELRACVDEEDLEPLKLALLAEWRNVSPESDQP